jgi:hypothetical protein
MGKTFNDANPTFVEEINYPTSIWRRRPSARGDCQLNNRFAIET